MALRPSTLILLCAPATLVACTTDVENEVIYKYPSASFSSQTVDFGNTDQGTSVVRQVTLTNMGDLNMGIASIELGTDDHSSDFNVAWTRTEIVCPDTPADTGAAAKRVTLDSGTVETGQDTAPEETGVVELVLEPDCSVPLHLSYTASQIGTVWGSLVLETVTDQEPDDAPASWEPSFYEDPISTRQVIYLKGESERGIPNILVSPRRYDFGHVWAGLQDKTYFSVRNLGDGTLNIANVYLSPTACDESFSITNADGGIDTTLQPGEATFVEVSFAPTTVEDASCRLYIESDDEDSPTIGVPIQGNTGLDPNNKPPTVIIREPVTGYQHGGHLPFDIELNIFDVNQPAPSLTCKVKSMVLLEAAVIADCTAPDDSGHVMLSIDPDDIGVGNDTFRVQVTDGDEVVSFDSIAILLNTPFPDSDDDGDGWGDSWDVDEWGNYDCDDHEINSYPYAVELPDRLDNDCDGIVDEGTIYYDDDGDEYTEAMGDCNDIDPTIYPGATEATDSKDNDCDGLMDEGTSVYDDDGDGFTELDGDCADADPAVNPGAVEYCDGIDNNCNGLSDYGDDCIELTSLPYIVGTIQMEQTDCESGDRISFSVFVFDADGQTIDYAWTGDEGLTIEPSTGSPTVSVTCPNLDAGVSSEVYSLYVVATDEDANSDWDFAELTVHNEGDLYKSKIETVIVPGDGGCTTSGTSRMGGLSIAGLALLAAALRRRQRR